MPDRPPADGSNARKAGPPGARSATTLSLANHFLIAMPSMADSRFSDTVVYLLEHTSERAMGVVINRPTDLTLEKLFERVDMKLEIEVLGAQPVCYGGPMATDRGFVLHDQSDVEYGSTLTAQGADGTGLSLTTSKDVLEAMADGRGPKHVMVALGYAGLGRRPARERDRAQRVADGAGRSRGRLRRAARAPPRAGDESAGLRSGDAVGRSRPCVAARRRATAATPGAG